MKLHSVGSGSSRRETGGMPLRSGHGLVAAVAGLCLCLSSTACLSTTTRPDLQSRSGAAELTSLDRGMLEDLFFEVSWESRVLRDAGEDIVYMDLVDDALYVFTDENALYAIDYRSGMVRWKFDVGDALSYPISVYLYPPEEKERLLRYDEVYLVSKDQLVALDKENGSTLWKLTLPFGVSSGPVASFGHVYVGSWDDRVYAIRKEDRRIDWFWRTDGDVTARAAQKSPAVYVCSEDGIVYSFDSAKGGPPNWEFVAERPVSADPLLYKNRLYVGCEDMNVYSIGILDGLLEWRFPTGAPISRAPVAIKNTIYVVSENNRLDAIHRRKGRGREGKVYREGQVKWSHPLGTQVLAKGRENVYVLTQVQSGGRPAGVKLVALDDDEGFVRWDDDGRLAGAVDFFTTNAHDPLSPIKSQSDQGGIIYLGYREGYIVALRERVKY